MTCNWCRYSVLLLGKLTSGSYFVHERGVRTGIMVLCLTCMSSLVAIIGGPITSRLGWRYMFIVHLPFAIAGALAVIFLVPETQFRHPNGARGFYARATDGPSKTNHNGEMKGEDIERIEIVDTASTTKKPYLQTLAPYSGTFTDESAIKLLVAPLVVLLNPAVFWVSPTGH